MEVLYQLSYVGLGYIVLSSRLPTLPRTSASTAVD
jgi:hypothetical protein